MSSPFSQHNQQPFQPQPGMGGYPQQGGYPQGGNQQGGYQQQGGYPQQAAQPSYGASPYGQPAYAGGPMGPQPSSSSSPSYGSKPTSKPSSSPTYGSKPSPTSGSGTGTGSNGSNGSNGGSDPAVENMIKSTCESQINTAIKGASITNQELFLINTSSDKLTYAYTGHVTGRRAKNNEAVDGDFTCKAYYDLSSGLIETYFE